ncbi:MAG: MoxR family ATPase [Phycisphaerales bacterium]|nr:MoxR family ATPase [Phycisphaerales bacterium]
MTSTFSIDQQALNIMQVTALRDRLNKALQGKHDVIEHVLTCLLARGHILLEDLPGLGKTTLARALSVAVGGRFARLQCTPDLLPNDITGFNLFNQKLCEFEFVRGPVFSDVLLADEINRATPRAQSALLEAMAERQVTVDNEQHRLSPEFFVIATQNPIEHHGTYPLPEAQLDRFAMKLSIGYPSPDDEVQMLEEAVANLETEDEDSSPLLRSGDLRRMQSEVAKMQLAPPLQRYLVQLASVTRTESDFQHGLSPRALLMWQRLAQARAFLDGRTFVTPDDIQGVAIPLFGVHLASSQHDAGDRFDQVLSRVKVPTELARSMGKSFRGVVR